MQRRVLAEEVKPPSTTDHFHERHALSTKITPSAAKPPFFAPIIKRPTARERFPIKFYLVCMIFILLDVDAAFFYPWALIFRELGVFGFVEMLVFILFLGGGFVYAWKVGALDW